jgi:hypothetical protein
MVIDDWRFPRRWLGVAGDDGGLGGLRRARKTARNCGARLSFDAPEREKEKRGFEGSGGGFTAPESMTSGGSTCELRRAIPAAWRLRIEREREEKGEGMLGFIGMVLMAS